MASATWRGLLLHGGGGGAGEGPSAASGAIGLLSSSDEPRNVPTQQPTATAPPSTIQGCRSICFCRLNVSPTVCTVSWTLSVTAATVSLTASTAPVTVSWTVCVVSCTALAVEATVSTTWFSRVSSFSVSE